MSPHPVAAICRTLGMSRSTAYRRGRGRAAPYQRRADPTVAAQIRMVIRQRASYGHRRVTGLVNRTFGTHYNRKRIRRVMQLEGLARPRPDRRRTGRAHRGRIRREHANERWCSDHFEVACWNGEVVHIGFVLDCHDRECLAVLGRPHDLRAAEIHALMRAAVTARFPAGPARPVVQWLSDNESIYTALETLVVAEQLHLAPITTPARSPQSNGMSEAFVNTMRRDYVDGGDCSSAAAVLAQLPAWIADYNEVAPHSALGFQSPREYQRTQQVRTQFDSA